MPLWLIRFYSHSLSLSCFSTLGKLSLLTTLLSICKLDWVLSSYTLCQSLPILNSFRFLQYLATTLQLGISNFSPTLLTWYCGEIRPDRPEHYGTPGCLVADLSPRIWRSPISWSWTTWYELQRSPHHGRSHMGNPCLLLCGPWGTLTGRCASSMLSSRK